VPISVLATTEASWQRHRARAEASDAAATLSVQILIPLGLLLLPAFVIVGVVPVVVSLLQDAIASGQTGLW
jgi:tight adherence protein B